MRKTPLAVHDAIILSINGNFIYSLGLDSKGSNIRKEAQIFMNILNVYLTTYFNIYLVSVTFLDNHFTQIINIFQDTKSSRKTSSKFNTCTTLQHY